MIRLFVLVEGETEVGFVKSLLAPHLHNHSVETTPILIPQKRNATSRMHKGGWTSYAKAKAELTKLLNTGAWCTTMLDLYNAPGDFPGLAQADDDISLEKKIAFLEEQFASDIKTDNLWKFIPYLQLHEFEALLFTEPKELVSQLPEYSNSDLTKLYNILRSFDSPEHINKDMPPSKRIIELIPEYGDQKASVGPLAAGKIGLAKLRQACPHFGQWLTQLEGLANQ